MIATRQRDEKDAPPLHESSLDKCPKCVALKAQKRFSHEALRVLGPNYLEKTILPIIGASRYALIKAMRAHTLYNFDTGEQTKKYFPSTATIAEWTGMHEATINRLMKHPYMQLVIRWHHDATSSHYYVELDDLPLPDSDDERLVIAAQTQLDAPTLSLSHFASVKDDSLSQNARVIPADSRIAPPVTLANCNFHSRKMRDKDLDRRSNSEDLTIDRSAQSTKEKTKGPRKDAGASEESSECQSDTLTETQTTARNILADLGSDPDIAQHTAAKLIRNMNTAGMPDSLIPDVLTHASNQVTHKVEQSEPGEIKHPAQYFTGCVDRLITRLAVCGWNLPSIIAEDKTAWKKPATKYHQAARTATRPRQQSARVQPATKHDHSCQCRACIANHDSQCSCMACMMDKHKPGHDPNCWCVEHRAAEAERLATLRARSRGAWKIGQIA